jgi:nucleotide-binding universal stress UspA family protein
MRILVGTDGSEVSISAAREARALLTTPAEYVLVSVTDGVDPESDATGFAGPTLSEEEAQALDAEQHVGAQSALTETAAATDLVGAKQVILDGTPGAAICDYARDSAADIIVVGSHGRGPIRRAVLGSVSDYVTRHAPCPVLVVRADLTTR